MINMKREDFLYTSEFTAVASIGKPTGLTSKASIDELEDLKKLITNKEEIGEDPDLLYTVFNCAVVNLVNKNGDAIDTETALKVAKYFKHKPTNIEHSSSSVVGYITNVGFSKFPDNVVVDPSELEGTTAPFNIALSAIVWKSMDPFFADYVKNSNEEENYCYKDVSTSWEIGFNEYKIAVGSKNLEKAKIISDKQEIEKTKKYLTKFGGTGFNENNEEVYLVICGEAKPLGIGFTSNPAAAVSGVLVVDEEDEEDEKEEINSSTCDELKTIAANLSYRISQLNELFSEKISHKDKNTVIEYKSMKFDNLDELYGCLSEASTIEAPDGNRIKNFIKEELLKADEKWKASELEKESKAAALQEALENSQKVADELKSVKEQFETLKADVKKNADQLSFDKRIEDLDGKYEMSAKLIAHISDNIFGKTDDEYSDWLANAGSVILEGKEKKNVPSTPEDALENSKASVTHVPNTSTPEKKEDEVTRKSSVSRKGNLLQINIS